MEKKEFETKVKEWAETLNTYELRRTISELVCHLCEIEEVAFNESSNYPYWDATGDSIDGREYDNSEE